MKKWRFYILTSCARLNGAFVALHQQKGIYLQKYELIITILAEKSGIHFGI